MLPKGRQGGSIGHSHLGSRAYKAATNCHHAKGKERALEILALAIKYFEPIVMPIMH